MSFLGPGSNRCVGQQGIQYLPCTLRVVSLKVDFCKNELRQARTVPTHFDRVLRMLLCWVIILMEKISLCQALLQVPG
jgi:hypothetical protein